MLCGIERGEMLGKNSRSICSIDIVDVLDDMEV
jgi:hypothetical protein